MFIKLHILKATRFKEMHMDPTLLLSIITTIGTSLAALVGVGTAVLAYIAIRDTRRQQNQPILAPFGEFSDLSTDGEINWDKDSEVKLTLRNIGNGPAFNIFSIICSSEGDKTYTSLTNRPSDGKSDFEVIYTKKAPSQVLGDTVDGKNTLYPERTSGDPSTVSIKRYKVARLSTTYCDLFGVKYISIFDYKRPLVSYPKLHGWSHVATKSNIKKDLEELFNELWDIESRDLEAHELKESNVALNQE